MRPVRWPTPCRRSNSLCSIVGRALARPTPCSKSNSPMQRAAPLANAAPVRPSVQGWSLGHYLPQILIAPSAAASFVYVFLFTLWTFYISLSNSSLLPTYGFEGFTHYV